MIDLTQKHCVPCEDGVPAFTREEVERYKKEISEEWNVLDEKKLERNFKFSDFKKVMEFINKVAEIAEEEQHHPDMKIFYSLTTITLWTHVIGGLSENDFIIASKIDKLL